MMIKRFDFNLSYEKYIARDGKPRLSIEILCFSSPIDTTSIFGGAESWFENGGWNLQIFPRNPFNLHRDKAKKIFISDEEAEVWLEEFKEQVRLQYSNWLASSDAVIAPESRVISIEV